MSQKTENELFHAQDKANYILDKVLGEEDEAERLLNEDEQVAVEDALSRGKLLSEIHSNRQQSRVLIVTNDLKVLEENSLEHAFYLTLSEEFDEMHIVVTASLQKSKKLVRRFGNRMWVYTTGHVAWYMVPSAIKKVVKDQLTFAEGFRPDFIVVTDPYESALGAYWLAEKYQRPFQVHVKEMFWNQNFKTRDKANKWRRRIAKWILKRVDSVRTLSSDILNYLEKEYKNIDDLAVLPRHYNLKEIATAIEKTEPNDLFPDFTMVILFVGKLDHGSTLFRAIDASRQVLSLPRSLMVVVGDGPTKDEFKKRTEILGIDKKVIFKPEVNDIVDHVKSADVFINTDTTEASDDLILKVAAMGVPMILSKTALRDDLFTDGEDVILCEPEDTQAFSMGMDNLINDKVLRDRLAERAQQVVLTRLHENSDDFYGAYQNTLERVFNVAYEVTPDTVDEVKEPEKTESETDK